MKIIRSNGNEQWAIKIFLSALFSVIILAAGQCFADDIIQITSPPAGITVKAGSMLEIQAECPVGGEISVTYVPEENGQNGIGMQEGPCPHGTFKLQIPSAAQGKMRIMLLGSKGKGSLYAAETSVKVEPTSLSELTIYAYSPSLTIKLNSSRTVVVDLRYPDGKASQLGIDELKFEALDPAIIELQPFSGANTRVAKPLRTGQTKVTVSFRNQKIEIPVDVIP